MEAAEWSAVAAIFAAISSFLIYRVQRGNLLESARPEITLTNWERRIEGKEAATRDVLRFGAITNSGRGSALHIIINQDSIDDPPRAAISTIQLAILSPNETAKIDGQICFWWKNVPIPKSGPKFLPIGLTIFCWDTKGMRHETRYRLLASELDSKVIMSNSIAPGVMLGSRQVISRSVRFLKLSRQVRRYWERLEFAESQRHVREWWAKLNPWKRNVSKK